MARVIIIGGSGHVGTYLVPRLIEAGHEVVNVTRGHRAPYLPHRAWDRVTTVRIDRDKAEPAKAEETAQEALQRLEREVQESQERLMKAAAERGWLDERRAMLETLTAIVRAGADIVITYAAVDAARWIREDDQ